MLESVEGAWWDGSEGGETENLTGFSFARMSGQTSCPEISWVGLPSRGYLVYVLHGGRKNVFFLGLIYFTHPCL